MSGSDQAAGGVRRIATEILLNVETKEAFADLLLEHEYVTGRHSERDRSLLTELVYGTLRWRGRIDATLASRLRRPLGDTGGFIRNLLRVTVYQMLYLTKIPDYAAVNEAVDLAKAHGGNKTAGFVNGVLRNILRQRDRLDGYEPAAESIEALAVRYSHPDWLVKSWVEEMGRVEAIAFMTANNEKPPLVARANLQKTSRQGLLQLFAQNSVAAHPSRWAPQGITIEAAGSVNRLPGFAEGLFQIQSEASQLIAHLLSPEAGERVLDACAAPGGKTTHIAELMKDGGVLVALDRSKRGVEKIRESAERLGLRSITAECADMTGDIRPAHPQPFDRVLVDAPCTGLGTLRGHPEIKWRRTEADVERLSRLQRQLLSRAADALKAGGVLVYSTCTVTRAENHDVIQHVVRSRPELRVEDAAQYLPPEARPLVQDGFLRTFPHRHDTDGFFAVRLRKAA